MPRISLLFSGLPGKMAAEVFQLAAEQLHALSLQLHPQGLCGSEKHSGFYEASGARVELLPEANRAALQCPPGTIAIDYSTPDAALRNIRFFVERDIPFIMGTTGFDRAEAVRLVEAGNVPAVIAPNMGIPILLIQRALSQLAYEFPGALQGYSVTIQESHQSTKKDTSGTAKALVNAFQQLGLPATTEAIQMVRDPEKQRRELSVPEEFLGGHAYHFYNVTSPDASVQLGLSHCIHGRRVYAEGTLKAVEFLAERMAKGVRGECYSMEDVLRAL
jgi:4-hydroxy-tetrahydrodipicolinate reductase